MMQTSDTLSEFQLNLIEAVESEQDKQQKIVALLMNPASDLGDVKREDFEKWLADEAIVDDVANRIH